MPQDSCDIAGSIHVALAPEGARVAAVRITSTRPTEAARVFVGKPVGEVTSSIGRIFSLCGIAQTVAALDAAEQALGIGASAEASAARDVLRLAEMAAQIVMRLGLHWPRALGLPMQPEAVRGALMGQQMLEAQLLGAGWRRPGAALSAPAPAAADTVARFAAIDIPALVAPLAQALAERGWEGYGALPEGMAPEVGSFARQWEAVAEPRAAHGPGLAARLHAAAADFTAIAAEMRVRLAATGPVPERAPSRQSGAGEATVETARGPLHHRMTVTDGIVTACQTEAPTEENFAADGPVAAGLLGAPADLVAAELHLLAIDPCVGCTVALDATK